MKYWVPVDIHAANKMTSTNNTPTVSVTSSPIPSIHGIMKLFYKYLKWKYVTTFYSLFLQGSTDCPIQMLIFIIAWFCSWNITVLILGKYYLSAKRPRLTKITVVRGQNSYSRGKWNHCLVCISINSLMPCYSENSSNHTNILHSISHWHSKS